MKLDTISAMAAIRDAPGLVLYIRDNTHNQWSVAMHEDDTYTVSAVSSRESGDLPRRNNGSYTCTCGKPDCKHREAIRKYLT